jgi:Alr-MurF fusion protein
MNRYADSVTVPMEESTENSQPITAELVAEITGGRLYGRKDNQVMELLTDSRSVTYEPGILFFAIKGPNHDGHNYFNQLYSRGVRSFVAEQLPANLADLPDVSIILVANSVFALQKLGSYRRDIFRGDVVGITGSAGKTIVKEWLADILSRDRTVVRSPKSYNSQTGVPLSLWKVTNRFDIAVIEAGISQQGEMAMLGRIIKPAIGVFTNIGDAHQENFPDLQTKIREKLILFSNVKRLVYPADNILLTSEILSYFTGSKMVPAGWSFTSDSAEYRARIIHTEAGKTTIQISWEGGCIDYTIPFADRASIENSVSVVVTAIVLNVAPDIISTGMALLNAVAMRMAVRNGVNNCLLIEDYYNSDPGSLAMALDYLRSQQGRSHTLILSDFLQTGRNNSDLAAEVSRLIISGRISRFIGIGVSLMSNSRLFGDKALFFGSTDEFLASARHLVFRDEAILLKGARIYEFERIAHLLEQKSHTTLLEVNLDAIVRNLNTYRSLLKPGVRIMAMVKAFAYGSGGAAIGSLLEFNRVDYLGVAYADEGVELRDSGVTVPVMVMNPDPDSYGTLIRYNLEPEIYSMRVLGEFIAFASQNGLSAYPVHIKIDTGMHRLGFLPSETDELIQKLNSSHTIRVVSVFSHLAASESPEHDDFTHRQAACFEDVHTRIANGIGYVPIRHLLNSAGISRFPQYHYEMVRPGLGLYGLTLNQQENLSQVSRYISRISQIKPVQAGEPVGYGCNSASESDRVIAIVPVGYADGLNRQMGNGRGALWIGGRRAPIVGQVCMDMCMADITGINASEGDQAEIFGENLTIMEMAEIGKTIPYEIITSIPTRVRRIFYRE